MKSSTGRHSDTVYSSGDVYLRQKGFSEIMNSSATFLGCDFESLFPRNVSSQANVPRLSQGNASPQANIQKPKKKGFRSKFLYPKMQIFRSLKHIFPSKCELSQANPYKYSGARNRCSQVNVSLPKQLYLLTPKEPPKETWQVIPKL
jgi:hypothetical protein